MEDKIINLWNDGYSSGKIVEKLGVNEEYIWDVLIAAGLL